MMSDIPRCPRGPGRLPRGSVPFVPVPWPRPRPPSRLPVLSVNGLAPGRDGDVSFAYVDSASYEPEYGDPPAPAILLKHGETVVAAVDASAFVIDGMVDDVEVTGGNLVITFNTAAGKRPISIPLTLFFDPSNYYDKEAADARFALRGEVEAVAGDVSALQTAVSGIGAKIPAQASSDNQLADKAFVNSSIATNTATFRGTYNLVTDLGLTVAATEQQVAAALAAKLASFVPPVVPENNDYCFVQVPYDETPVDPEHIERIDRYKCTVTESGGVKTRTWGYEFSLNHSSFTEAQWAAINSGITSGLVAKLGALPTAEALARALAGKQDALTFDNAPTSGSNNPVKSGGIWSAIWGTASTAFSSLYDWCAAQLAGKASTADATLTERFSEWTFTKSLTAADKAALYDEDPIAAENDYALSIRYEDSDYYLYVGEYLTAALGSSDGFLSCYLDHYAGVAILDVWQQGAETVATRTPLPGYQLGSQDDKPLASEAEAEALRMGKANRAANPTAGNLAALDANGNPTDSGVKASDKLDASSASAPFSSDSSVSYIVGSHVTYNGKLYKCTTATTGGTWVAASWAEDTMTDPDAVLDITAQNQLRVVAKDGTLLWAQGYDLASTSSATLACDAANNFTFADGATTQAFTLPTAPTGKVGDFGLDIDNSANTGAATMTLTGLDTTFSVVVPKGESLTDMLAIAAGELAQFYFTLSTFRVNNLPTWHIVKQVVENGGAQS